MDIEMEDIVEIMRIALMHVYRYENKDETAEEAIKAIAQGFHTIYLTKAEPEGNS